MYHGAEGQAPRTVGDAWIAVIPTDPVKPEHTEDDHRKQQPAPRQ